MGQPTAPVSPCIQVCQLDGSGYCTGCYRTIDEIARWGRMTATEQRAVLEELPERAAVRAPRTR